MYNRERETYTKASALATGVDATAPFSEPVSLALPFESLSGASWTSLGAALLD